MKNKRIEKSEYKNKGDSTRNGKPGDSSGLFDKRRKRKKIAIISVIFVFVAPIFLLGAAVGVYAVWADKQSLDSELLPTASAVPVFYDSHGNKLDYSGDKYVKADEMSAHIKNAFVALEDKRFYSHKGYDAVRICGALLNDLKAGQFKEGGSTITQQLVKNTHLTHERTVKRKLKEIALAVKIEKKYTKDEILSMYLSVIYFGKGAYGLKDAAALYFDKDIEELTLSESAMLAGIIKNPAKYSPLINYDNSIERRNLVLKIMREQNRISEEEYKSALAEKIKIQSGAKPINANKFYIQRAEEEVCAALGITEYQLNNSGFDIYLNIDADLQRCVYEQSLKKSNYENEGINSAAIVIENETGRVLAHSSTLPYEVKRQAGSSLKPLAVYAPALDKGLITLATPVNDEKININGFSPENYGGVYYGKTNPREAIKKSMNSVAVKVMNYLGVENSLKYLNDFGISVSEADASLALALGANASGFKPVNLASAYSALANGGLRIEPKYVSSVLSGGAQIYSDGCQSNTQYVGARESRRDTNASVAVINGKRVVSEDTAFLITSALVDTVKAGTARGLAYLPYEIAAKTGTASRSDGTNTDAWNVGYTTKHTVLVWHGADEGMSEKGGGYATLHAGKIWQEIYRGNAYPEAFMPNERIIQAEIDTYSTQRSLKLVLANEYTPQKYRKQEIFSLNHLPSVDGSYFSQIRLPELEIATNRKKVDICFLIDDIYEYSLIRNDALGEKVILNFKEGRVMFGNGNVFQNEDGTKTVKLNDVPLSFGNAVEYTLKCILKTENPEIEPLSADIKKSVFLRQFESEY